MNYLFFILSYIFSTYSISSPIKPKLCMDCAFFTKDFFTTNKYGARAFARAP